MWHSREIREWKGQMAGGLAFGQENEQVYYLAPRNGRNVDVMTMLVRNEAVGVQSSVLLPGLECHSKYL